MNDYHTFTLEIKDSVAKVTLNRPDKANAISTPMWDELKTIFQTLDDDPQVRVCILAGNGKHFSAGIDFQCLQDIKQAVTPYSEGRKQEKLRTIIRNLQQSVNALVNYKNPIIAAIHGSCIGAGVDIICACDIRYASECAKFSVKEVDLGIVADLGSIQRLPHIIGEGMSRELIFTGRNVNAQEAQSMGLVNQTFSTPENLMQHVESIAIQISKKSPLTIRGIKDCMNYSLEHSITDSLEYVALRNSAMLLSKI